MLADLNASHRKDGEQVVELRYRGEYIYDVESHPLSSIINLRDSMGCERRELPVASYVFVDQIRHSSAMKLKLTFDISKGRYFWRTIQGVQALVAAKS